MSCRSVHFVLTSLEIIAKAGQIPPLSSAKLFGETASHISYVNKMFLKPLPGENRFSCCAMSKKNTASFRFAIVHFLKDIPSIRKSKQIFNLNISPHLTRSCIFSMRRLYLQDQITFLKTTKAARIFPRRIFPCRCGRTNFDHPAFSTNCRYIRSNLFETPFSSSSGENGTRGPLSGHKPECISRPDQSTARIF